MNQETEELIKSYGWIDISSKNPYMRSFKKEETGERMNVYHTTMTITVQDLKQNCASYKNIHDLKLLEEILNKHK